MTISVVRWLFFAWIMAVFPPLARAENRANVVLISIDTLRHDRLGCTGYSAASTPNLDQLAKQGALFDRVFTPVPLTLPAHTAMLTSSYPPSNGVRDNGEALAASVPTLAEQFQRRGYETAAFVGAFVLDRRFGLARGFDTYWGDFSLHRFSGSDPGDVQIRGDRVEAAAEQWLDSHGRSPFFLFVHFYDVHGPYSLPSPWRTRFAGRPYDGEAAYVDTLIGKLRSRLEQSGMWARTAFVVTSDHGEGLGDHGERNHGFFIYRSTTQVPLIVRLPGSAHAGVRVKSVTRLIDVAPTLLAIAGIPAPPSFQGRNLTPEIEGQSLPRVAAYSETLYPFLHFHTSPLYAWRDAQDDYIFAPHAELYDMTDTREASDLAQSKPDLMVRLRTQLAGLMTALPHGVRSASAGPEVTQKLRSLGYLGGAAANHAAFPPVGGADPKQRMALFRRFQDALAEEERGQTERAAATLEQIAATDAALVSVQIEAGLAEQRLKNNARAVENFRAALAAEPENALAHYNLAISLSNLGNFDQAIAELNVTVGLQPWYSQAFTARGLAQARVGKLQDAVTSFERAIAIDGNDFDAWLNLGVIRGAMGDMSHAFSDLEKAIALEPKSAAAHEALGTAAFHANDLTRASKEYSLALELNPDSSSAHSSLGLLYAKQGKPAEARVEFQRALALDAHNTDAIDGMRMTR